MSVSVAEIFDDVNDSRALPDGWRWMKLGEVANYINGRAFKPEDWSTSGLPIIRIQNLNSPDAPYNYFEGKVDELHKVNAGDLLISWSASLDAFIWKGEPAILNQHIFKVEEDRSLIRKDFLYFAAREVMSEIRSQVHGATMKHITKPEFERILIPLPPLDEQKRIAAILTKRMELIKQAQAAVEEQLKATKLLSSAYLRSVFESEEAKKLRGVRLGSVLQLRKEVVHPRDKPSGSAVFVGLEHIQSFTGIRIGSVEVEKSKLTGRKPQFYQGDIVYGYLRPYLNKVWIAEFDGLCSVDQYVYEVVTNLANTEFIAWFMRSPVYLERAPIDTTPGQLPRIRTEEVASVEINLPSLKEQQRIVDEIKARTTAIELMRGSFRDQLKAINKLPTALLRQAFSGEL